MKGGAPAKRGMKKGRKKTGASKRDPKKDAYIRTLISIVETSPYSVRHERLKRGLNWSVQSGICEVHGEPVVFVDRTLSQDDQLDFLVSTVCQLQIEAPAELLEQLPESLQKMIGSGMLENVA